MAYFDWFGEGLICVMNSYDRGWHVCDSVLLNRDYIINLTSTVQKRDLVGPWILHYLYICPYTCSISNKTIASSKNFTGFIRTKHWVIFMNLDLPLSWCRGSKIDSVMNFRILPTWTYCFLSCFINYYIIRV